MNEWITWHNSLPRHPGYAWCLIYNDWSTLNSPTTVGSSSPFSFFPRCSLKVSQKSVSPLNSGTASSSQSYTWEWAQSLYTDTTVLRKMNKPLPKKNNKKTHKSKNSLWGCRILFWGKGHISPGLQWKHRICSTSQLSLSPRDHHHSVLALLNKSCVGVCF